MVVSCTGVTFGARLNSVRRTINNAPSRKVVTLFSGNPASQLPTRCRKTLIPALSCSTTGGAGTGLTFGAAVAAAAQLGSSEIADPTRGEAVLRAVTGRAAGTATSPWVTGPTPAGTAVSASVSDDPTAPAESSGRTSGWVTGTTADARTPRAAAAAGTCTGTLEPAPARRGVPAAGVPPLDRAAPRSARPFEDGELDEAPSSLPAEAEEPPSWPSAEATPTA